LSERIGFLALQKKKNTYMNDDKTRLQINTDSGVDDKTVVISRENTQVAEVKTHLNEPPVASRIHPAVNQVPHPSPGTVINKRFVLEKQLGFGGMGAVYRALDKRKQEADDENPYVAIKLLGEDFKNHPKAFITLQRETKKTQQLAHPNIVTVHDFDRDGDLVYMTMEELKGQNLEDLLKAHASSVIEPKRALTIIRKIASGLGYAHSKGIVHSDLKPGNIFITDDDNVKILDFGIARVMEDNSEASRFDAGELGALSPRYASVEMINHLPPDPKDDIYALGIIACELLTGSHPYRREMATDAVEKGMKPEIPELGRLLKKALRSAVTHDINSRAASCDEFIRQLDFAAGGYRKWMAGAVIVLLLAIGNIVFLEYAREPELALTDLSIDQQQQFAELMAEAATAMEFNDINGALFFMDKAYQIHPQNRELSELIDTLIQQIETTISRNKLDNSAIKDIIATLNEYPAFQNDKMQAELSRLSP
jgi:serine/threonine protein kinase